MKNQSLRKLFQEFSFHRFAAKVIGVVASGAGPVAVGWLGWKGYVKNCTPIVQVNVSERRQAKIVSIDAEYLEDCAAVDEVKNVDPKGDEKVAAIAKKYPTTWIKLRCVKQRIAIWIMSQSAHHHCSLCAQVRSPLIQPLCSSRI